MHSVQTQELLDDEEQKGAEWKSGVQEILPVLQQAYDA
jgi:hypothetical protein